MKSLKAYKTVLTVLIAVVLLVRSAGASSWLTNRLEKSELNGVSQSQSRRSMSVNPHLLSIGSLGGGSLSYNSSSILELDYDQIMTLLELSSNDEYASAEELLKDIAYGYNSWAGTPYGYSYDEDTDISYGYSGMLTDESGAGDFEYHAYKLIYEFTYVGTDINPLDALVRFIPGGSFANEIAPHTFALQTLSNIGNGGDINELQRLSFTDSGSAYYYPGVLKAGETITLAYIVFMSDSDFNEINFEHVLKFDLIQAENNAPAINWDVTTDGNAVSVFSGENWEKNDNYREFSIIIDKIVELKSEMVPRSPVELGMPGVPGGDDTVPVEDVTENEDTVTGQTTNPTESVGDKGPANEGSGGNGVSDQTESGNVGSSGGGSDNNTSGQTESGNGGSSGSGTDSEGSANVQVDPTTEAE